MSICRGYSHDEIPEGLELPVKSFRGVRIHIRNIDDITPLAMKHQDKTE